MINNGKYSNGGCAVNPFACLNDGLIDLTWVRDPSYMGMFGFREIINDAKVGGGIQAYKKHSIYMRGRKIKATFISPETETVPAETPGGEEESKETPIGDEGDKIVGVDNNDLMYSKSVTWQSFPGNIEVLFNTEMYFLDYNTFPEVNEGDPEAKHNDIVEKILEEIWEKYDAD